MKAFEARQSQGDQYRVYDAETGQPQSDHMIQERAEWLAHILTTGQQDSLCFFPEQVNNDESMIKCRRGRCWSPPFLHAACEAFVDAKNKLHACSDWDACPSRVRPDGT